MNDKKRVLKEFQWFQVQTKVRQIISEIVEPLEKKILGNTLSIAKLHTRSDTQQKKVQYLTLMTNNDPNIFEHGIFATIDNKIKESTIHTKQLQSKVKYLQDFIDKKVQLLELRLRESSHVLDGLREFKKYVDEEITNQNNKLIQSQINLFSNFDHINKDINASMLKIGELSQQLQTNTLKIAQLEKNYTETSQKVTQTISNFTSELKEITFEQSFQGQAVSSLTQQIKKVNRFQKFSRQLQSKIQHLAIAVDNVEYKAQVIQPIVALTQINEYAHHVLPLEYRNNVSIYYYNRYREMVEQLIASELGRDEKQRKVTSHRKLNLQLVKQVHQRAIKCVFKVKKHKLAEQGIDIDSLSHDKKEELLNNMHLNEQFKDIVATKSVPQKQQNRQKLQEEEYTQLRDKLTNDLRARMEVELKDSKNYILVMEELLKKELEQSQRRIQHLQNSTKDTQLNLQLEGRFMQQLQQHFSKEMLALQKDQSRMLHCLRNITTVVTAHQLIEKQDEKDRLSIALLGIREHHRDELKQLKQLQVRRPTVEVSPECLSCSGNANYYNQFFKMACLNYTSSPVKLNNQLYERIELLDKMHLQLQQVSHWLQPLRTTQQSKQVQSARGEQKMNRYESQVMVMPSRDSRSASDSYMIRNVSTSQDMRSNKIDKSNESPRVINSNELIESLMNKSANRLFNRKRDGLRDYKRKKESSSRESQERSGYMMNVSNYFKELKKQNESFIK